MMQANPVVREIESGVTPEMIVARARAIAQTLVAKQADVERRTFYDEETHHAFKDAGFYRVLTPKRYGGLEFGIDIYNRVSLELAAGCASSAWMLGLGSAHALQIGALFEEEVQAEVFADPDLIAPNVIRPSGVARRLVGGDWEISGVFPYCSGAPYSNWFFGKSMNADGTGQVMFLAPRSVYTRLDDWGGQLGMRGSGSHSLKMDAVVLPARLVFPGMDVTQIDTSQGTPGARLHGNLMYAGSAGSFFLLGSAAMMVGIAKNGLGAYEDLMHKKTVYGPPGPRTADPFYQAWYGTVVPKIAAAEAIVVKACEDWMDTAGTPAASPEADLTLMGLGREASDLAWAAMSEMMRTASTSALSDGARMQRVWRDMSTVRTHNGVTFFNEASKAMLAQAHFGVGRPPPPHPPSSLVGRP